MSEEHRADRKDRRADPDGDGGFFSEIIGIGFMTG
jgi:hypothetical protein